MKQSTSLADPHNSERPRDAKSLVARSEYEVFQRFKELVAGRMAVLISHRFSTVRMANRIYVIEDGRVSEHGTHEELIALNGTYATWFGMQASAYQ